MVITKETFRTLIHEGHEDIQNVDLYDRPFEFEKNGNMGNNALMSSMFLQII